MKKIGSKISFKLLIVAFAVSFVFLLLASLYALRQISSLSEYSSRLDHTNAVISELYKLDIINREMDVKERGYMLTHDSNYINDINMTLKKIMPATTALKILVQDNQKQLELITQLRSTLVLRIDAVKKNLRYNSAQGNFELSPYFGTGKKLKEQAAGYILKMQTNEYKLLQEAYNKKENSEQLAENVIQTLLFIFFSVTFVIFLFLIRQFGIRQKYQYELQNKVVELKTTNEELEQIAYVLSHNLSEPLRKIQIFNNKLTNASELSPSSQDLMCRVTNSAEDMHKILQDIDVLLGLKKDNYEETVNLNEVISELRDQLKIQLEKKDITFHISSLPEIIGNYRQITLLFKSLLNNAYNFAKPSAPLTITISDEGIQEKMINDQEESFLTIRFSDNGIGFENKYSEKIFRLFQQLEKDENAPYQGKGIGLALCRKIMHNHNGFISALGKKNEGAIFTLYFPVINS